MPKTSGWALIGCGGAGRAHAQGAAATPGIELRGFCDVQAEAAQTLCQTYGGAYHTTDPAQIFADDQVDIVAIATAHDSHAPLALAACAAGKHLYLEKPMAMTTADCLRIEQAAERAGLKLMLNFSIRFSGAARLIKERLGPVKVSHAQCMMGPADLSRWRWHPAAGGGPLYDVGVHALDLLCWLHQSPPVEIHATGGQITHPGELGSPDMVDTAAATLRFGDGAVSTFLMSDAGSNPVLSKWFFQFFDGTQSAVLHEHFTRATFGDEDSHKPPAVDRLPFLVEAIRNDTEPFVGSRDGVLSSLLIEKLIASIHTQQPQAIEIPPPLESRL